MRIKLKYQIQLFVISTLLFASLSIATSYSLWQSKFTQTDLNVVKTECFEITFTESSNLNLNNASPMSDTTGLRQKPYTFTVKNNCNLDSAINVIADINNSSTINSNLIKLSYKKENEEYSNPKKMNAYQPVEVSEATAKESYIVLEDTLLANQTKTYDINVWVDRDATNDIKNKTYSLNFTIKNNAVKMYRDKSNASTPDLIDGLTPVYYENGKIYTANVVEKWYDYDSHEWANAVILNSINKSKYYDEDNDLIPHEEIDINDISQMYVWIPRYKYQLFNVNHDGTATSNEQMINVEFVDNTVINNKFKAESQYKNGEWYVHPAFTFGDKELNGIWVGKFETSGTTSIPTILPNQQSLTNINVSTMFTTSLNIKNQQNLPSYSDSHMMKNMEWGAVAYLTNSKYGLYINLTTCLNAECEVWINNVNTGYGTETASYTGQTQYSSTITGCSGENVIDGQKSNMTTCENGRDWKTQGIKASTTQNMYGIYDMSGGTWEYVMGSMIRTETIDLITSNIYGSSSGFGNTFNYESKYIDLYKYSATEYKNYNRGHLGDATREIIKKYDSDPAGWYGDYSLLPYSTSSWFVRGGNYTHGTSAGVLHFGRNAGVAYLYASFRVVLVSEK